MGQELKVVNNNLLKRKFDQINVKTNGRWCYIFFVNLVLTNKDTVVTYSNPKIGVEFESNTKF